MAGFPSYLDDSPAGLTALLDASSHLCCAARQNITTAEHVVAESRLLVQESASWKRVRSAVAETGDEWVACCSYCGQVRGHDGEWMPVAASVLESMKHWRRLQITHGICPDCIPPLSPP